MIDEWKAFYLKKIKRDWGFAKEYVEGMWRILQASKADNYVLSTNETHSVRDWVEVCFKLIDREIIWEGKEEKEIGRDAKTGKTIVEVNPAFYRPVEVEILIGDYSKAKNELGWEPKVKYKEPAEIMLRSDINRNK